MSASGHVFVLPSNATLNITKVVNVVDKSFGLVVQWEKIRLPSRLVIGSGELRRVTVRIRQQPIRIMETVHNSLATSQEGQTLCARGAETARVLSNEKPDRLAEEFAKISLEEIRDAASRLNEYTKSMYMEFRDLRVDIFNIHSELSNVTKKREGDLLARLSRSLSKDVRACEADLETIGKGIQEIEESLSIMTRLWHKIANHTNYLLGIGKASSAIKQNPLILQEIRDTFTTLKGYFDEYSDKIYRAYDENIGKLNSESRKHLREVRWRGAVGLESPPRAPRLPAK